VTAQTVQIGKKAVPMDKALKWVAEYTDAEANQTGLSPYAYPAYDTYQADENLPGVLTDADLLAPVLLNVTIKIRSFYALQRVREQLQVALVEPELETPLAGLPDERIDALIGALYSVLDADLWGVQGTTLSKILHRKRPSSVALHDTWVKDCYVGNDGPVLPAAAGERSWSEYMATVSRAMARDLRDGAGQFKALQAVSGARPALSDLRLLDILAWNAGQCGVF
jgi:hypothetical protein